MTNAIQYFCQIDRNFSSRTWTAADGSAFFRSAFAWTGQRANGRSLEFGTAREAMLFAAGILEPQPHICDGSFDNRGEFFKI